MRRILALLLATASAALAASPRTALDRYVAAPDSHYKYELIKTLPCGGCTAWLLDMTSQQWKTGNEVDRPVWKHWVTIVKPDKVASTTGFLFITGGSNDGKVPDRFDPMLRAFALDTASVVTEVRMIPNEPLTFASESKSRTEDGIIAYTWDKFLRTGDESWPLRLPMTKAAVRAMDTAVAFTAAKGTKLEHFVVAGGSKRGWTTWTTAAVDKRVSAIIPMVIDLLNIEKSFEHHWRVYGFWAPAVHDYEEMGIMEWSGTPQYKALMKLVEPYSYRDRYTMPKYMIYAAGDQFFLPDSSQFYFDGLKGEKHLRYVPNADHSLRNTDARESLEAFYAAFVAGHARPRYSWKIEKDGSIRVNTADEPAEVKLWRATNPDARDFRLEKIGPAYTSTVLKPERKGLYVAKVGKPARGYTAFFVEMTYPSGGKYPFKFTSGVKVVPDTLPYPPYQPKRAAH